MAEIVRMPRLSDTMTEGTVAKWHKKVGDTISEGDLLAEIETDKATMEFESFQEGVLLHIGVEEASTAPVDCILAVLGEEGEDVTAVIEAESSPAEEVKEEVVEAPVKELVVEAPKAAPAPTPVAAPAPAPVVAYKLVKWKSKSFAIGKAIG
jgi:pyruvate dehydrogenase E2 component (dihydrolipoamide acetyltransferase)